MVTGASHPKHLSPAADWFCFVQPNLRGYGGAFTATFSVHDLVITTPIDYAARLYYNMLILAHLGRVLEAYLNAERGVASCGSDS